MTLVSQALIDQFDRDGYVVVPGLLSDEELAHFGVQVRKAVAARKQFDDRQLAEKSLYEQSFLQCINLWEDFEEVRPLTFHPRIGQAAAELLGVPAVRLFHDQALFKEAGGRETDAHQDLPYWPIAETETITAWIPFAGSTLENGCMGYVPGSHKSGTRKFVNIFRAGVEDVAGQAREIMGAEPVYIEVPPGSVAFHHGLTAHNARPNKTDTTREVHTMIYFRDGCTRSEKGKHDIVDRPGIAIGAPIASNLTPLAWPRASDELPVPPPPPVDLPASFRARGVFPGAADPNAG